MSYESASLYITITIKQHINKQLNVKLMLNKRLRITVGIPTATQYFHQKFVQSLMALQYPPNTDAFHSIVTGYQLPFARNRIVEEALKNESDYVLFIDADMIFPPDLLTRLLAHNKDIVNALAFRRTSPHYPCIFKWDNVNKCYQTMSYMSGLLEVDACGMNNMLINTDVFRKLKKPWYYYRDNIFSSDLTFCENAKKAGYSVHVDTDQKMGHIGNEQIITEEYYINHLSPEAKEEWNKGMKENLKQYHAKEKENYA